RRRGGGRRGRTGLRGNRDGVASAWGHDLLLVQTHALAEVLRRVTTLTGGQRCSVVPCLTRAEVEEPEELVQVSGPLESREDLLAPHRLLLCGRQLPGEHVEGGHEVLVPSASLVVLGR